MELQISHCVCNGIFNHTSLCEFYQGKLLLHLTIPFEEKSKTNLPGDNLRYYRQRKQMTTRQLAEKLDIVPLTVVMYEKGKHPIPYDVAIKLEGERKMIEGVNMTQNLTYTRCGDYLILDIQLSHTSGSTAGCAELFLQKTIQYSWMT